MTALGWQGFQSNQTTVIISILSTLPANPPFFSVRESVANSGKLSSHGRRSRPLWQVNRLCRMEEESKLADTF